MKQKTVTIVKSKAPWYAFDFLLNKKFRKVAPIYQKVEGLLFKAFSSNTQKDGKKYGGIYLWDNKLHAQNWYTPDWFAEIKRKRGALPLVNYYSVITDISFVSSNTDYSKFRTNNVVIFVHSISESDSKNYRIKADGLFRVYLVSENLNETGIFLFFESKVKARLFIKNQSIKEPEWFKIPILLNNIHN